MVDAREQIAEHRRFLAKITAEKRVALMGMVSPPWLIAADAELNGLLAAALEEWRFLYRMKLLDQDGDLIDSTTGVLIHVDPSRRLR